jgi:hypothetical protein
MGLVLVTLALFWPPPRGLVALEADRQKAKATYFQGGTAREEIVSMIWRIL